MMYINIHNHSKVEEICKKNGKSDGLLDFIMVDMISIILSLVRWAKIYVEGLYAVNLQYTKKLISSCLKRLQ